MDAVAPSHRFAARIMSTVVLLCGLALAASLGYLILGGEDMLRAYLSPEQHQDVYELAIADSELTSKLEPDESTGDFDGDGVADQVSVDYVHREPLFDRTTSGMVYVCSGRTGDVLLAHAVPTPLDKVWWCGDRDGSGTDDILIRERDRQVVFGRRR